MFLQEQKETPDEEKTSPGVFYADHTYCFATKKEPRISLASQVGAINQAETSLA